MTDLRHLADLDDDALIAAIRRAATVMDPPPDLLLVPPPLDFTAVHRAASCGPGSTASSGHVGHVLAAPGVWTALGGTGYELRTDVSAEAEWAVAVGWPLPDRTTVAARLLLPGVVTARQRAEPIAVLDAEPAPAEVVAHHITTWRADSWGRPDHVNHAMIRKAPEVPR